MEVQLSLFGDEGVVGMPKKKHPNPPYSTIPHPEQQQEAEVETKSFKQLNYRSLISVTG